MIYEWQLLAVQRRLLILSARLQSARRVHCVDSGSVLSVEVISFNLFAQMNLIQYLSNISFAPLAPEGSVMLFAQKLRYCAQALS